jgi:hypothetical protein
MQSFLAELEVYDVEDGERRLVPLMDHAVLVCQDVEAGYHEGSVWIWGDKGRPRAIFEGYWGSPLNAAAWPENVIHSMSLKPIVAQSRGGWTWQPKSPAYDVKRLGGVPKPRDTSVARMRQIKNLATKFTAHEFFEDQRTELRLLSHPLHEYRDESAKILDGALFVFVRGNVNAGAILLIEAVKTETEEGEWQFGFVRMNHAKMHAYFDGREVWSQPHLYGFVQDSTSPYFYVAPIGQK